MSSVAASVSEITSFQKTVQGGIWTNKIMNMKTRLKGFMQTKEAKAKSKQKN
jgi:hypothetical protein